MSDDYKAIIPKIEKKLKKKLSDTRYQHTLGVAYTAGSLAMKYSLDVDKAIVAGLLHDCVKYMTPEKMMSKALSNSIEISTAEREKPDLLHAKLGSLYAAEKYNIIDDDILSAIRWHTTGRPDMTLFEKIIYIADYIEPNRDRMPRLEIVRKLAFENIDECLLMILSDSVEYLKNSGMQIDETTILTYEYYKNIDNTTVDTSDSNSVPSKIEREGFVNGRKDLFKRRCVRNSKRSHKGFR